MSSSPDYYQILNVGHDAGLSRIKRAYRNMVAMCHPDHVPPQDKQKAEQIFKEVVEAYYVLSKKERRKIYDQQRAADQSIMGPSEVWSFVQPTQRPYDPDVFNYYLREQRAHNDAFKLDWRDILGGVLAKAFAVMLFVILFFLGHVLLPGWLMIDLGNNVLLPWPALVAVIYILIEPIRDFVWDFIAEDETYDAFFLLMSWLILVGFIVLAVVTVKAPPADDPAAPDAPAEEKIEKSTIKDKLYPVNMEVYNVPKPEPESKDKIRIKGSGEI